MEFFYLMCIVLYAWLLLSMRTHWQQRKPELPSQTPDGRIAILIPFRNESRRLPSLLENLNQILSSSQEVVFINDGSEDESKEVIHSFIYRHHRLHWVLLDNHGIGKKAALTTGVNYTQAEIILTTDADCVLPSTWVHSMGLAFGVDDVKLVSGPVMTVEQDGFFARFQQIEWASILLMTHCLFFRKRPLMCSGANLAYRKSAFEAVGGYRGNEHHLSGDDEFLLKKIVENYGPEGVTYLHNKDVLVQTYSFADFSALFQQRIRWASKWRLHKSSGHAVTALLTIIMSMIELSTLILLLGSSESQLVFFAFWLIKIGVEKLVLGTVLADYNIHHHLSVFFRTSLIHPIYVIAVGFGAVIGKYSWKGRNSRFKL